MGARLVPGRLELVQACSAESGGGLRGLALGVRLIARPDGTVVTGSGLLPGQVRSEVEVPDRLGGGILFASGTQLWQARSWLGPLRLLAVAKVHIDQVLVGLDRVYLRLAGGSLAGIDPRDGASMGLGPLPAAPWVGWISAQDAWHAAAFADLRGDLVTDDAGTSWSLSPARAPQPARQARRSEGPCPQIDPNEVPKLSGARILEHAVADGWPLADGTALVARDGTLTRVSLADGGVVEEAPNAFAMNPARCHPFSLATPRDRGAFGYTCGQPGGPTRIYFWAPETGRLVEARRFSEPRQVNAFGNGALAVRGSCQEAGGAADSGEHAATWCAMAPSREWSERTIRGAGGRMVVLSDARIVVLQPPADGDLATARIVRVEGERESARPLDLRDAPADASRALRLGVWMDGFEERRPGWIGGWIDLAGSVMGVEISLEGQTHVGPYIRDAQAPVVGGRWGFGWSGSSRGLETIDGGMTWNTGIVLPAPFPEVPGDQQRACGPVGCVMNGWVRVGWGSDRPESQPELQPLPAPRLPTAPPIRLDCESAGSMTEARGQARPAGTSTGEPVTRFPPLGQHEGPTMPSDAVGLSADTSSDFEAQRRSAPLARAYAWGPRDAEWDGAGQWQVLWVWPWGQGLPVRASGPAPVMWPKLEVAQAAMRSLGGWQNGWTVIPGDDPDHALLVLRGNLGPAGAPIALLETGRAPEWIHLRMEPFEAVEGATRVRGRWVLATSQRRHDPPAVVLWMLDGQAPHELARLPRVSLEGTPRVRIASRSDGRAVGVAVEGQPDVAGDASIWVASVDLDTGAVSDPEPLANLDVAQGIHICDGDEPGWLLDLPYPASVDIRVGPHWGATLTSAVARVRLSAGTACVENVLGATDREAIFAPLELSRGTMASARPSRTPGSLNALNGLNATVYCARQYFHLRCTAR
jgi:hypothetical protein